MFKIELTEKVAKEMGNIFNITTSVLGSAVGANEDGSLAIGPPVDSARGTTPYFEAKPYSVNALAHLYIEHLRKTCPADAAPALDALDTVRQRICSKITQSVFHLFHPDLRMPNVFVESAPDGEIQVSGIIDWDLHTFLPAPLAADYPIWLRFDGFYDPKFNPRGGKTETWWEDEHDTIRKLRVVFKEVRHLTCYLFCALDLTEHKFQTIRESHNEFYDHICNGTAQRELFYWFNLWEDNQPTYNAIVAWSKGLIV